MPRFIDILSRRQTAVQPTEAKALFEQKAAASATR
jgi:hypothetical protein